MRVPLLRLLGLWLLLLLLPAPVLALGDRQPEIRLSAHVEGNEVEGDRFVIERETPVGARHFRRIPEFTQEQIRAYQVIESPQGLAVALQLDDEGRRKLQDLSLLHQGRGEYLLLAVDGEPREFQRIDQPIEDGIVIIWQGLAPDELEALDAEIRHNNR